MRRWLAALALVPAVAWGQEVCTTPDAVHAYGVMAETLQDQYRDGLMHEEARHAVQLMATDRVTKAVWQAGVDYVYEAREDFADEEAAQAMREACISSIRRR